MVTPKVRVPKDLGSKSVGTFRYEFVEFNKLVLLDPLKDGFTTRVPVAVGGVDKL